MRRVPTHDHITAMCSQLLLALLAGGPRFQLATRGDSIGKRCRPCGACDAGRRNFFDECYIVKNELCMLTRACRNGASVWRHAGEWQCDTYDTLS